LADQESQDEDRDYGSPLRLFYLYIALLQAESKDNIFSQALSERVSSS